jgi:hypothetical protein
MYDNIEQFSIPLYDISFRVFIKSFETEYGIGDAA